MGTYAIDGIDIGIRCETSVSGDHRGVIALNTSNKILFSGQTRANANPNSQFITYPNGYFYARHGLKDDYFLNGTGIWASLRGFRPTFTERYSYTGNQRQCINWFSDGEVWISLYKDSRSGTRISTAAEKRRAFCMEFVGGGSVSAGGGAGAAFGCLFFILEDGYSYSIDCGSGGKGGAGNTIGGRGGPSEFRIESPNNYSYWSCGEGGFGYGGGGGGSGGAGGNFYSASKSSGDPAVNFVHVVTSIRGGNGGDKHNDGNGASGNYVFYSPEANQLSRSCSGGGSASTRGGGGGGSAMGFGGAGGMSGGTGQPGTGYGAGGGGGIYVIFSSRAGGDGSGGKIILYY